MVIKAVIFDMDGIIFDTEKIWQESFKKANHKFKSNVTEEFRQSTCGKNLKTNIEETKRVYPNLNVEGFWDCAIQHHKNFVENFGAQVKEGFISLIKFLKLNNIKIALATGGRKHIVEILFKKASLNMFEIFNVIITGNDIEKPKPNPEIFIKAVRKLNIEAKDCIVIEDSINGLKAAKDAGCKPIMVIDIIKPNGWAKQNCYKIFDNLIQVENFLKE